MRDPAALETALSAAIRAGELEPEAEQRALAAFRAARGTEAHRARTRRRDDWRVPAERRARRPVRMALGVAFASLTLGGAAVAAIGSAGSPADGADAEETTRPTASAPGRPGDGDPSTSSRGPSATDGPARAQDTEAHCRAYERVGDRGKALDARAWQQLVAAAGGKDEVAAYCAEQLARATAAPGGPGGPDGPGNPGEGAADTGNGTAGNTGASRNGTSGDNPGDNPGGADSPAGRTGSGKDQ
ncbi:hypothetical protein ACFZC6_29955 [Streptomyces ossamyceticus]|uniref:Uncharacterized protein n=1 Tax=Streptomyces ossamyceticus TaxID=249581 RepID=A0ABV2UZA9_9ACTN